MRKVTLWKEISVIRTINKNVSEENFFVLAWRSNNLEPVTVVHVVNQPTECMLSRYASCIHSSQGHQHSDLCICKNLYFENHHSMNLKQMLDALWLCDLPRRASNRLLLKIPITLWMAVLSCCSSGFLRLVQYSSKSARARAVSAEHRGKKALGFPSFIFLMDNICKICTLIL